jgi:hypothetical protein
MTKHESLKELDEERSAARAKAILFRSKTFNYTEEEIAKAIANEISFSYKTGLRFACDNFELAQDYIRSVSSDQKGN